MTPAHKPASAEPSDRHPRPPSRRVLAWRLFRNAVIVGCMVLGAVALGAIGYHVWGGLSWLDAALNAAMILTGMGPVNVLETPGAKIFAIAYALFSGVFFLTMVAVLLAPALHHFLHRFHLELREREVAPRATSETVIGRGHSRGES